MAGFVTTVEGEAVTFRLADDAAPGASEVTLWSDVDLGAATALERVDGGWALTLADLPVDLLEYQLVVDGDHRLDPGNPATVDGAFGPHSVLALPTYQPPAWLGRPEVASEQASVAVEDTPVGDVEVTVWAPRSASGDDVLPLLLAHDGPEMAAYGGLLEWAGAAIATGDVPPMRIALLGPGLRDEWYAANPAYAAALLDHVVPFLVEACPTAHRPLLIGQSLGGLAALHAAWTRPDAFAGLLLQSGSFFTRELDAQESGYAKWEQVTGFVRDVQTVEHVPDLPPITLTCGTAEENNANNHLMAGYLSAKGCTVSWGETRQGHTWTCWRDLLHPHLDDLVRKVWT